MRGAAKWAPRVSRDETCGGLYYGVQVASCVPALFAEAKHTVTLYYGAERAEVRQP